MPFTMSVISRLVPNSSPVKALSWLSPIPQLTGAQVFLRVENNCDWVAKFAFAIWRRRALNWCLNSEFISRKHFNRPAPIREAVGKLPSRGSDTALETKGFGTGVAFVTYRTYINGKPNRPSWDLNIIINGNVFINCIKFFVVLDCFILFRFHSFSSWF